MAFGRLERTEGPRPISEINVTPLVDVMLVLVAILIVTAPLLASSLRVELPRADATQPNQAPAFVTVGLDASGRTFFDDQPVDSVQLADRLAATARRSAETEVHLRADRTVPYGRVVEVMGAAQKAGLNRIAFVAEPAR